MPVALLPACRCFSALHALKSQSLLATGWRIVKKLERRTSSTVVQRCGHKVNHTHTHTQRRGKLEAVKRQKTKISLYTLWVMQSVAVCYGDTHTRTQIYFYACLCMYVYVHVRSTLFLAFVFVLTLFFSFSKALELVQLAMPQSHFTRCIHTFTLIYICI
ncbi:unnamed protein product [Ceratitis capitata]|uniref:(Mediterranean fruit fly) hypothetical protein n=1 Tax=Ceratitis capitata TaxID=7213 RepID=A0A811UKF2_CERCA|nr:unnamed protein product [Ceratitis capitata]